MYSLAELYARRAVDANPNDAEGHFHLARALGRKALSLGKRDQVKYAGDVQVGGTIASVGQRMIQGTAKMMAAQFFTCLGAEAKVAVGGPPPKHGFFRNALRWFSGLIKSFFRKH